MTRSWSIRLGAGATAIVALGSAILSWDALSWGAGQLGVDGRLTWLYPVVIDGTITVATIAALALRGARARIRVYVWTLLAGAVGASVVGNGAHAAAGNLIHVVGAAVPAVALAASLHLLVILVRHVPASAPAPSARAQEPESAQVELEVSAPDVATLAAVEQRAEVVEAESPARAERAHRRAPNGRTKSVPKRARTGSRANQMRALLAEPGSRALTGEELGARLGINAGYARRLRSEIERPDSDPARRPRVLMGAVAPTAAAEEA